MADLRPCCHQALDKMLKDLIGIFNASKLHYWLDWGSLLGLLREGHLIHHDKDIDFGIFEEDINKYNALRKEVAKAGYRFSQVSSANFLTKDNFMPRVHLAAVKAPHCYNICATDICVWTKIKKTGKHKALMLNCPRMIYCDLELYEQTDTLDWQGLKVKVPKNPEEYIAMRYGEDWRTPDPLFYRRRQVGSK